ncbi:MAG: hypothetical protein Q7T36_07220 [Fluviicoccus sp.]|uniref:hypothetical protein n=1 Tax=Fluviicoccus sp. TaxID=2003552 RepID=UPI002725A662|nr:hypothetical protein [Fluviicoccus sp.]MDO8330244.1 hypothetical protein [Fluviicoccus sp.]
MSGIRQFAQYRIDGKAVGLNLTGETVRGPATCLLLQDDDLTQTTSWHSEGFVVRPFLSPNDFQCLQEKLLERVHATVQVVKGKRQPDFSLDQYHRYCADSQQHMHVVRYLQEHSSLDSFPLDFRLLDKRVSEICGLEVSCAKPGNEAAGRFFLRIVRPGAFLDNNPPHRDVWLDRLRHAINIYVPLAGSNALSSLPLIPRSHCWLESEIIRTTAGAVIDGVSYTVPSVVGSDHGMDMIRPVVGDNEVMVFSPYLVHGGGVNFNTGVTRVSLEMRFWRKDL